MNDFKIAAVVLTIAVGLCGCSASGGRFAAANNATEHPAIAEARTLEEQGQREQAAAVLRVAAAKNPNDRAIRAAYGKSLISVGNLGDAERVLAQAHTPDRPDPSVLSAQGVAAAQKGDYQTAVAFFTRSLNLKKDPAVMSNMAMTLAFSGKAAEGEQLAREAVESPQADARIRLNYALLLAMQGKEQAAEEAYRRDLSPEQAAANVDLVRRMSRQGA